MKAGRAAALGLAALGFIWTAWLMAGGGGDFNLIGLEVRSHEPLRPFTIGCLALAAYVLLQKDLGSRFGPMWKPRLSTGGERKAGKTTAVSISARNDSRGPFALSVAVAVFGVVYATTAASGSDPYGYVSQADLWLAGDLHIEQPWVADAPWPSKYRSFAPLGYRPSDSDAAADGTIVPTYPAGLALLMAGAKAIGGQEAMFWIVPISGGLLVFVTYLIGVRIAPPRAAVTAAWLMASCPVFLYMLVQPMSDVPAAAAWMTACWFLLRRSVRAGVAGGLAAALAVLIRPNLVFLVVVLAAWPLWQARLHGGGRRALMQTTAFCSCASLGAIAVALLNQRLYGSFTEFGYGDPGVLFSGSHFVPNLVRYFSWLISSQTIVAAAGLAAILFPWRTLWPNRDQRRFLVMPASVVASVWLFYCFYLEFDAWWSLRFMLPALPFVAIGTGAIAAAITRTGGPRASALVAIALALVVMAQYRFAVNHGVLDFWSGERRYVGVARLVRADTDEHSVIFGVQHCGSVRYYGGRTTVRFESMDGESLDQAVQWLWSRGVRSYLLAEDWELAMFRDRFAGQATLARLETPLVIYRSERHPAALYDLTQASLGETREVPNPIAGLRSARPAPAAGPLFPAQRQANAEGR